MARNTPIQWCDDSVNPTAGCEGCELHNGDESVCYAAHLHRTRGRNHPGFAPNFDEPRKFPGRMTTAARASDLRGALRPEKPWLSGLPRIVFVSDMGDALSQSIEFDYLHREIVLTVTSERGSRHEWLWLTKRPHRMALFSSWLNGQGQRWPRNLWAGTSLTTQTTTARVAQLLRVGDVQTVRFVSLEPQRERVAIQQLAQLDLIIQGGESGRAARPFDLAWARELRDACAALNTAYFLKQLGRRPFLNGEPLRLRDPHGGDWSEWPDDLRVRQFPTRVSSYLTSARRHLRVVL